MELGEEEVGQLGEEEPLYIVGIESNRYLCSARTHKRYYRSDERYYR